MTTGLDLDNQRIAIAQVEVLRELVKAIREMVIELKESNKPK